MTLERWRTMTRALVQPYGCNGAQQALTAGLSGGALWELYHLDDYVVSSAVSGPSVVLVPRG